jgi:predicted membrane protein
MDVFIEFLLTYIIGIILYPLFIAVWGVSAPIYIGVWVFLCTAFLYLFLRYRKRGIVKIFVAVFVLPSTVICGAATVVPWPIAILSAQSNSGCTPIWALLTSLVMNFIVVYIGTYIVYRFKHWRQAKNA